MPRFVLAAPVVLIAIFVACVTTPVTNRQALNLVSDAQMNQLGLQAWHEVIAKEKISRDPRLSEIVSRVGRRIAAASGQNYDWEFVVIDSPKTVNAFCLPGGKIAVYTGILPVAQNEAALAAVLGHEVAHATARHGAERMSQGLVAQFGMQVVDQAMKDSKYRGLAVGALGVGAQFGVLLPYSRLHEAEADKIGLLYMAKAGYDPVEAPALWLRMAGTGQRVPEFISTHQDPLKRAEQLEKSIPDVLPAWSASERQPTRAI